MTAETSDPETAILLEQAFAEPHGTIIGFPAEPPAWRRKLIEAMNATVVVDPGLPGPTDLSDTMPDSMTAIAGHDLATSTDCTEHGCPKEAGTKGGPYKGLCDEHAELKKRAITEKRLATRAANNGHDAGDVAEANGDGPTSIEQAVKAVVPIGRELDRKLRRRDRARSELREARDDVRPVLVQFADALAALRAAAEEAVK